MLNSWVMLRARWRRARDQADYGVDIKKEYIISALIPTRVLRGLKYIRIS